MMEGRNTRRVNRFQQIPRLRGVSCQNHFYASCCIPNALDRSAYGLAACYLFLFPSGGWLRAGVWPSGVGWILRCWRGGCTLRNRCTRLCVGRPGCWRASDQTELFHLRILANIPIALLLLFFLAGDRIICWDVLLVGLGWRFWLLCYVLPSVVSILSFRHDSPSPSHSD